MTNKIFLVGLLAIALVFGMTVVGCEEEEPEEASIETKIKVEGVPSSLKDNNFTMSLIYTGDGRTIGTVNGVIAEVITKDKDGNDLPPVYTANAEFDWEWKGDMTTKPGTGPGLDSERLFISGRVTLKIGNDTQKTANSINVFVGSSVNGYGASQLIPLEYADFN
jgi:hypothetical protein